MGITRAAEELQDRFEHFPWLNGVGIGVSGGQNVIFVYVNSSRHRELDKEVQGAWHGFRVVVKNIGKVKPAFN